MPRPRIGAVFAPRTPVRELPDFARRVEALGFDELWLAEDCGMHGGLTAATAALGATNRIGVGVGLLPVTVRNPAFAAMELATVAELHPGRLTVAFGHGVESWMRNIGARPPDRIAALEQCVGAVRALLRGEPVTLSGGAGDVRLEHPPAVAPSVFVGTTGERGIAVARRAAEGLLLPEGAGEAAVRWAASLLAGGTLVVYGWLRIAENRSSALEQALPTLRDWRVWGLYPNLLRHWKLADEDAIDEDVVRRFAVAGAPADCASAVQRLGAAGAARVVLWPVEPDPMEQLERFAADAMPLVLADSLG